MTSHLASNALYRKYEEEKSFLETYGHVSSLTYEEWLETKKTNKAMETTIKWQKGKPKENGIYLVTTIVETVIIAWWNGTSWLIDNQSLDIKYKAWCKLNDIEPYKVTKE